MSSLVKMRVFLFLIVVALVSCDSGQKDSISTRIVGGKPSAPGQFPYQAYLDIKFSSFLGGSCGGSLISVNRVLTAAHCIYQQKRILLPNNEIIKVPNEYAVAADVYISLGVTDLKEKDKFQKIHVQARDIIPHPQYNPNNLLNDIAIIRLTEPAKLNRFVEPIYLPQKYMRNLAGKTLVASGWGQTRKEDKLYPTILRYVNLKAESKKCEIDLHTEICTSGTGGVGACFGDSGGPLAYKLQFGKELSNYSYYILFGVSSSVSNKCRNEYNTYFIRVSEYVDWIRQI